MRATIYVIPGSTSSMAGRLMLEHKGIDYRRRDLVGGPRWRPDRPSSDAASRESPQHRGLLSAERRRNRTFAFRESLPDQPEVLLTDLVAWLAVGTLAIFPIPVLRMRRRLIA
jgi:hypothetical protein